VCKLGVVYVKIQDETGEERTSNAVTGNRESPGGGKGITTTGMKISLEPPGRNRSGVSPDGSHR